MEETRKLSPIAIVAMGATFPGRGTTHGFWRDIMEGVDTSRDIPATHWRVDDFYDPDPKSPDKTYSSRGAFIPAFPFDPVAFGTPPNVIETTDTVQLLALHVAKQVLAGAQPVGGSPLDLERTSVVLGVAVGTELLGDMASRLNRPIWIKAMREEGLAQSDAEAIADRISNHFTEWRENTFPGLLGNVVAGRIANRFGLGGSNFTTDAACASSLAAIRHAAQELWLGESDTVLAGGADALNNAFMYLCFSKTPAMSASGKCRPFSDDADGTLMGEGCGIFALRRLEDAQKDGNTIHAVITGIGASSDGRGSSVYAPRAGGQALAIRRALGKADVSPRTVELMEAHGTGTRAGDAAEFKGLREVFGEADEEVGAWCALGSIKSQIGHTKSAAGAAGLAKVVLALRHKVLPPTINVRAPNPALGIEGSSFYLNTKARPWVRGNEHPRRASISSFGFGGTNFHMTLEEYSGSDSSSVKCRTAPTELFLFSASSGAELGQRVGELAAAGHDDGDLPHHAAASQCAFDVTAPQRLAFVVGSWGELSQLVEKLRPRIEGEQAFSIGNAVYNTGSSTTEPGKTAYLFSGQGSQYLGMGADLAMASEIARAPWDWAASDPTLRSVRLHNLAFPPAAFTGQESENQSAELARTENTQPSIGLIALGQLGLLRDLALQPDCVAGHSFGEIMALHAAGALDGVPAIMLARARGEAMAQAASAVPGGMLAVFAGRDFVDDYLADRSAGLVLANDNAPDQIVLSGPIEAIEKAERELSDQGVRVRRLDVSTAFHSPLVAAATADLQAAIASAGLRAPQLPVYANLTGELYPESETAARELLAQQLTKPVRFREMIENMYRDGVRTFVEVGPSSVLSGLVGSILKDRTHVAVALDQRQMHGVTALHHAVAKLAVAGHEINFDALWAEAPAPEPRQEPKKHEIMLTGANYGKRYPPQSEQSEPPESGEMSTLLELRAAGTMTIADTPVARSIHDATAGSLNGASPPQPAAQAPAEPVASPAPDAAALSATAETVREVVAEKTGYPADMLDLDLDLEAELGIDSIKQVEILSALREKIPAMPEIEPARLAELRTLQLIAEAAVPASFAAARSLNGAGPPQPAAQAPAEPMASPAPDSAALSATAETVREVVAEKTGYPADMLDLDLDLEAELGIDSIKQVEILSALREKIPAMPEIEPARLAELRTLQLIAEAAVPASSAVGTPTEIQNRSIRPNLALPAFLEEVANHGLSRQIVDVDVALPSVDKIALSSGQRIQITSDAREMAGAIADALQSLGFTGEVVDTPSDQADAVIVTSGLADGRAAMDMYSSALAAARKVAGSMHQRGGWFILLQDTGGDFGRATRELDTAARGGLTGLAKTAALEWPHAKLRVIDIDRKGAPSAETARRIAQEILCGGPLEVGLKRDGSRLTPAMRPAAYTDNTFTLPEGANIVVSGGGRGITSKVVRRLAGLGHLRFLVLGRSELCEWPSDIVASADERQLRSLLAEKAREKSDATSLKEIAAEASRLLASQEIAQTIAAVKAAGSDVSYVAVDIADAAGVAAAVNAFRAQNGPITGLIHGAGQLADKLIKDKTEEQLRRVLAPKVQGFESLWSAVAADDPAFVALFSSIAGRLGNPGQADYAMANEILNRFAWTLRQLRPQMRVMSMNWGPWLSGMVTDDLRARFEEQRAALIPEALGVDAFVAELFHGAPEQPEVVFAGRFNSASD